MNTPDRLQTRSESRIRTTVVGSYPVPEWLIAAPSEQGLIDATQEMAGVDVVCDGELYRFDLNHPETNGMIEYFVRPMQGVRYEMTFDEVMAYRSLPGMRFRNRPPGVVEGALSSGMLDLPLACQRASALATHTFKFTVTGPHNVANALAAAAMARSYGVPAAPVRDGLRAFRADPHRSALVRVLDGVTWVDDSKATNPHAAAASLASYDPVVWIAGGLLKGADVEDLVRRAAPRLRAVVLLGVDRAVLSGALTRHAPEVPVVEVDRLDTGAMEQVVVAARRLARPGDTVLLAPAAASMDCFRDYNERGELFAAAALALG